MLRKVKKKKLQVELQERKNSKNFNRNHKQFQQKPFEAIQKWLSNIFGHGFICNKNHKRLQQKVHVIAKNIRRHSQNTATYSM